MTNSKSTGEVENGVDGILEEGERAAEQNTMVPNDLGTCKYFAACMHHSGVRTAVKYLAKESDKQWDIIQSLNNRMWAILIGVCGTFFLVLVQMFLMHIKH